MTKRANLGAKFGVLLSLLAIPAAASAAPAYTPTMADMMSINATVHRYMVGLDGHNGQSMASAFAEEGVLMLYDHGKLLMNLRGRGEVGSFGAPSPGAMPASQGAMPPPPGGMPPGGMPSPPGGMPPPPGGMPPQGVGAQPPGAGGPPPGGGGQPAPAMHNMFHFIANDYYDFVSPTRMNHYAYWMDVTAGDGRTSTVGIPGHYEDVFVKRGNDWYILERKIFVGTK